MLVTDMHHDHDSSNQSKKAAEMQKIAFPRVGNHKLTKI
jgi:hypothetical protein